MLNLIQSFSVIKSNKDDLFEEVFKNYFKKI